MINFDDDLDNHNDDLDNDFDKMTIMTMILMTCGEAQAGRAGRPEESLKARGPTVVVLINRFLPSSSAT